MGKSKKKKDESPEAKSLTPDQVKEITDYIQERKTAGIKSATIRKEVFKKFGIDTTQWQLQWDSPEAKTMKGDSTKNHSVDPGKALVSTSNITRRHEPVSFKYEFSPDEINTRANTLAQLELDKESLEEEKKMITSDFKAKIEEKETQIGKVAREINSGFEMRNDTCEIVRDFDSGMKTIFYRGKQVQSLKLTAADYTLQFPDENPEVANAPIQEPVF